MTQPPAEPSERTSSHIEGRSGRSRTRRSRSRRSQRPATDGIAEEERDLVTEVEGTSDADAVADGAGDGTQARPTGAGSDAWWQEQRPPHWS